MRSNQCLKWNISQVLYAHIYTHIHTYVTKITEEAMNLRGSRENTGRDGRGKKKGENDMNTVLMYKILKKT